MKHELNGLLLVDKPQEMTSHDVVAVLRKSIGQRSIGHTGTLDPLATGMMVMVLGEATKLSDYLMATDKSYSLKIRLGVTTDTLDRTGKVLTERDGRVDGARLREAVSSLQGEFDWQVPLFSAAKVDGKKLYEHGRAGTGDDVVRPTKRMKFWDLKILEMGEDRLEVSMSCSKGSFVRTWASQLGERLGTGATVEELRRLRVGTWDIGRAATLEQIAACQGEMPWFVPMGQALPDLRPVCPIERCPIDLRNTFNVPKMGVIAGCFVVDGKITRNNMLRLVRDSKIIYEGKVSSLKRFKDDAREVASGFECGIGIENFNDIKVGDVIEAFVREEQVREL